MATRKQPLVNGGELKLHVKAGDKVQVISGNDKGVVGEILHAHPREQRVVVQGVNKRWKHRKPTQQNPKGERVQEERPIHVSNVKLVEAAASGKRS
ncbi:MAG: 50S ribosomal protein L24 [Planctomycetes bacterium]|nr:50S ribosomal protein L24 [Planctomycetota bacterium]